MASTLTSAPPSISGPVSSKAPASGLPNWLELLQACGRSITALLVIYGSIIAALLVFILSLTVCEAGYRAWVMRPRIVEALDRTIIYLLVAIVYLLVAITYLLELLFWPVKTLDDLLGPSFKSGSEGVTRVWKNIRGKSYRKAPVEDAMLEHDNNRAR